MPDGAIRVTFRPILTPKQCIELLQHVEKQKHSFGIAAGNDQRNVASHAPIRGLGYAKQSVPFRPFSGAA